MHLYFSTFVHTFIYISPSVYISSHTSIDLSIHLSVEWFPHLYWPSHPSIHLSLSISIHLYLSDCPSPPASIHSRYFLNVTFLKSILRPLRSDHSSPPELQLLPFLHSLYKATLKYLSMNLLGSRLNSLLFLSGYLWFCCSLGLNSIHPSRPRSGVTSSSPSSMNFLFSEFYSTSDSPLFFTLSPNY